MVVKRFMMRPSPESLEKRIVKIDSARTYHVVPAMINLVLNKRASIETPQWSKLQGYDIMLDLKNDNGTIAYQLFFSRDRNTAEDKYKHYMELLGSGHYRLTFNLAESKADILKEE